MLNYRHYREIADAKGMSDYKIAKVAGISRTTLCDWKAERYVPTLATLFKIAEVLEVPLCELIGEA